MTEYNILGLKNYIFNFFKNLTPRKKEKGFEVLEKRYYENLNTDVLTAEVHRKIEDKLAEIIADKYVEDLLHKE